MYTHKNCPTCHHDCPDPHFSIFSTPRGEETPMELLTDSWTGFFKERLFFTYGRCSNCKQIYSQFHFSEEQLAQLYEKMDDNTFGMEEALMVQTQEKYFESVFKKNLLFQGSVLELGPDIGLFTREVVNKIKVDHYWLVEPNINVHDELISKLQNTTYTVLTSHTELDKIPDSSLSFISAIHVLEHLADPDDIVSKLYKKLMPGGVVFFVTHDVHSMLARWLKKRWSPFCLQHLQLYSRPSLRFLLKKNGFKKIFFEKSTNYFPLPYLLKHLCYAALGITKDFNKVPNISIGVKLGNIITVAVK